MGPDQVNNSLLSKIVREAYDRRADSGEEFTLADVIADILDDPTLDSVTGELVEAAVAGRVKQVDKQRTDRDQSQEVLFGDSDQVVPLGEGRRRRKGSLRLPDVLAHLALVDENKRNVIRAAELEEAEATRLLPYMRAHNVTWERAVVMYLEEHPEEA